MDEQLESLLISHASLLVGNALSLCLCVSLAVNSLFSVESDHVLWYKVA